MTLDLKTRTALEQVGWSEEYQMDISRYEEYLQKDGYTVFPVALDFLKKFGGIKISNQDTVRWPGSFCFKGDPIAAARFCGRWDVTEFEEALGRPLCPIAQTVNGTMSIFVDEEGRVYANDEQVLYYLTDKTLDLIRIVCSPTQEEFVKLFELD